MPKYVIIIAILVVIILIIWCLSIYKYREKNISKFNPIYEDDMYYKYLIDHTKNVTKPNLVITLSLNYKIEILQPFFESLRCYSPESELLIFTDRSSWNEIEKYYPDNKGHALILTDSYPYYPINDPIYPIKLNDIKKLIPTHYERKIWYFWATIRYFLFNAWLKYYGSKYNQILIIDSRDVLFQSNPFKWIKSDSINLQAEVYKRYKLSGIKADGEYNLKWIKSFNPPDSILSHQIINGGQMLGTSKEMCIFINEFTTFLLKIKVRENDQAALNYFYYTHKFNYNVIVHGFRHGFSYIFIKTISYFPKYYYYPPVNNYLLNRDNSIPPILHGYSKKLLKQLIEYHTSLCYKEEE